MKKIISLFKRDYEGNRQVFDKVVPGAEWVLAGEGWPTLMWDGTCCLLKEGKLYKRYDRRLTKLASKRRRYDTDFQPDIQHYKVPPVGWIPAEPAPDPHSGHWPGWLPVGDGPEDKWHREGLKGMVDVSTWGDGTYELIGPKVQGNPYNLGEHVLIPHGDDNLNHHFLFPTPGRSFEELREWFEENEVEGIVWHHNDGRMVKIKRKDFGLAWPVKD